MNNVVKEYFEKIAKDWKNNDNLDLVRQLLKEVNLQKGDKVIDAGCGKGIITPLLYELTQEKVIGIDFSKGMIEEAMQINNDETKYQYICCDFIEFESNYLFDSIIIYNAYPHFLDINSLKNKAYALLKPHGSLVIMHSLSRDNINNHHKCVNCCTIARDLETFEVESIPFLDKFDFVKGLDEADRYLLILKKKQK